MRDDDEEQVATTRQRNKRPDTSVDAESDLDFKSSRRSGKKRKTGSQTSRVSSRILESEVVLSSDRMN